MSLDHTSENQRAFQKWTTTGMAVAIAHVWFALADLMTDRTDGGNNTVIALAKEEVLRVGVSKGTA